MKNYIKYDGPNNSIVLTDWPIEALKKLQDSVKDAIDNYHEQQKQKYLDKIIAVIEEANEAGYEVYIDSSEVVIGYSNIEVEYGNDDED